MQKIEHQVQLDKFKLRPYQYALWNSWLSGKKKILSIQGRRAGKDMVAWNLAIRQCLKETCTVYYMLPKLSQARKVIWQAITNDGRTFMDYIPAELIFKKLDNEMSIQFINGSRLQLCGSDSYDRLVGTNPKMVIFSEYALADPEAYTYLRPIVVANNGIMIFISTPRGRNHFYNMYSIAKDNPEWFCELLTVEDTQHISLEEIQKEEAEGLISRDKIKQEYYCDFNLGIEGTIFGRYLEKAMMENRVTSIPYEQGFPVHTAWDIGRDTTAICFFQIIGGSIRYIDYYEKANENLEYFARILEQKGYRYGKACFPHDMAVTEWSGAKIRRLEKAKMYGLDGFIVPSIPLEEGIEHVRANFNRCWFDEKNCARLISALENYQRTFDEKTQSYSAKPLHNQWSHPADSFRYSHLAIPKLSIQADAKALDERYKKAILGPESNLPPFFR